MCAMCCTCITPSELDHDLQLACGLNDLTPVLAIYYFWGTLYIPNSILSVTLLDNFAPPACLPLKLLDLPLDLFLSFIAPPYNSHEVEIEGSNSNLGVEIYLQSTFIIRWPQKILPKDDTSYDLEIEFYFLNLQNGEWNVFTAYQAVENTGEYKDAGVSHLQMAAINYQLNEEIPFLSIIPFIVNVRVSNTNFSKWSGVYFFGAVNQRNKLGNHCTIPKVDSSMLPPCPLYERQAILAGSGFKKEDRRSIQTNSDSYQSMYVQSIHSIKSMDIKSCFVEENLERYFHNNVPHTQNFLCNLQVNICFILLYFIIIYISIIAVTMAIINCTFESS